MGFHMMRSQRRVAYKEKIVSIVCDSIPPDIKWDDSHVQGKSNICKVIGEKLEGIGVSNEYNVKVVGLYGVGGVGKTTTCQTLCNELSNEYEGRVCHIELPNEFQSVRCGYSKELFQKVARDLTWKSWDVIQHLNEGECIAILRKSLLEHKTFLAIDNFSDCHQSIELAKTFLDLPYHMDSLVVVTARSQFVLEHLRISQDACLEMPDLGEVDAMRLFLHHVASNQEFFHDGDQRKIMTCVQRCYFFMGDGQGRHYHPLALKSLGLQLRWRGKSPSIWVEHLPHVRNFDSLPGGNPVFDILRSGFDLLSSMEKALFMDLHSFVSNISFSISLGMLAMLCAAHDIDEEEIIRKVEDLTRKGLLEHVDFRSGEVSMHDLYWEFAELEVKVSFKESTNLKERTWARVEDGKLTKLKHKPKGECWDKLIRLTLECPLVEDGGRGSEIGSLEGIKWEYFCNVEVLQLCRVHLKQGALNLMGLKWLRILILRTITGINGIEGLGELENLTYFVYCPFIDHGPWVRIVGQLPLSLKLLKIRGSVVLESNALARCQGLVKLSLSWVKALSLDLSNCWCLQSVDLFGVDKLRTLLLPTASPSHSLQFLGVWSCQNLVDISGIDHFTGLKELRTNISLKLGLPSLVALTKLEVLDFSDSNGGPSHSPQSLEVWSFRNLVDISRIGHFTGLKELRTNIYLKLGLPSLVALTKLEVLDLSDSNGFTSLIELGDLLVLRVLDLRRCEDLLQLPDLTKALNLEKLYLAGCSDLELHEKDIDVLSKLCWLQPLLLGESHGDGQSFRLDLSRGKVLVHQSIQAWGYSEPSEVDERVERNPCSWELWKADGWEERDLGPPPIAIGMLGPFYVGEEY